MPQRISLPKFLCVRLLLKAGSVEKAATLEPNGQGYGLQVTYQFGITRQFLSCKLLVNNKLSNADVVSRSISATNFDISWIHSGGQIHRVHESCAERTVVLLQYSHVGG